MQNRHSSYLSLLAFLFLVPSVYGQITSINILSQLGYNRIGSDFWASGGAGIAEQGLRVAAFANPALLSFNASTITVESGWRPKTDYLSGIEYDNTTLLPSYASAGFPVGLASIEAGYSRSYNDRFSLPDVLTTTVEQPDGTGERISAENRSAIQTIFGSISYPAKEDISLGLTVGMDFIKYDGHVASFSQDATGRRMQFILGAVARPSETASFGLTVCLASDANLNYSTDATNPLSTPDSSRLIVAQLAYPSFSAKTPLSVEFGGGVDVQPWLRLLGSATYQNWSAKEKYLDDILQYHVGVVASPLSEATFRAGYFTQRSSSASLKEYFDEYFLTAGASWKVSESLTASIAYMTSAPFTNKSAHIQYIYNGESIHQSMLSGGISFSW